MSQILTYADRSIQTRYYVPHLWYPLAIVAAFGSVVSIHETLFAALTVISECYDECPMARPGAISNLLFFTPLSLAIPGIAWTLAERWCQPIRFIRCCFGISLVAWLIAVGFTDYYFRYF